MEMLLKNHKINCEVIKRKRKTMEIQVQPDGSLRVLVPKGLKTQGIRRAIEEKEHWIINKIREIQEKGMPQVPLYEAGELHYGFGNQKPLGFVKVRGRGKLQVRLRGKGFIFWGEDFSQEAIKKSLEGWYRKQTEKRINYFVKKYRNTLPRPKEVQVKTQKKRWGSCNQKGKVMFNWKLSMAPAWVLEYLVVHELCHIEEFNHSKGFWDLVRKTYPRCDEARVWLRENQWSLQGF